MIVSFLITEKPTPCSDLDALVYIFLKFKNECWIVFLKKKVIIMLFVSFLLKSSLSVFSFSWLFIIYSVIYLPIYQTSQFLYRCIRKK